MLVIEISCLLGTFVATDRRDRRVAEWPPHPDRLFSAMVCACEECNLGDDARKSLEWLEQQDAPAIDYSTASRRDVHSLYVPVNDDTTPAKMPKKIKREHLSVLPTERARKERFFPTMIPSDQTTRFLFDCDEVPADVLDGLTQILEQITYLGHSTSPVIGRVRVIDKPDTLPAATPVANKRDGNLVVRVAYSGRYRDLSDAHDLSLKLNRRIEPKVTKHQHYRTSVDTKVEKAIATGITTFGGEQDWFVYRRVSDDANADKFSGALPLSQVLSLGMTIRKTLIKYADQCGVLPCEIISGHDDDGGPTKRSHVAIIPLAYTGHRYSSGQIEGFAVVLPREHDSNERQALARTLAEFAKNGHEVQLSDRLLWRVERHPIDQPPWALVPKTYLGFHSRWHEPKSDAATDWTTVTPMVFGRFPGRNLRSSKSLRVVAQACHDIGLPAPIEIDIFDSPILRGSLLASQFPRMTTDGKLAESVARRQPFGHSEGSTAANRASAKPPVTRFQGHLRLKFEHPVCGPVILGAGRFLGMGLCKPIRPRTKGVKSPGGDQ